MNPLLFFITEIDVKSPIISENFVRKRENGQIVHLKEDHLEQQKMATSYTLIAPTSQRLLHRPGAFNCIEI
jgi:hypothetical protein